MVTNNPLPNRFLSPVRQKLMEMMREVCYGRINHLVIRDGEPVLTPRPHITLSYKFGGDSSRHARTGDLALKQAHIDLFRLFEQIGNGTIDELTITNGLPLHAERTG